MELRQYLSILKRQLWIVVGCFLVVTVSSVNFFVLRTPAYRASASVLIQSDDPGDRLSSNPNNLPKVRIQASVMRSPAVAIQAAAALPGLDPVESQPARLLERVSVTPDENNGVLTVHATHPDPVKARDIADAFAAGYVEVRRRADVEALNRISEELNPKLESLLRQIQELDAQIADGGLSETPSARGAAAAGPPGSAQFTRYGLALQYQKLFEGQQQLLVEQSLKEGRAQVFSTASIPLHPTGPGLPRTLSVATFVGLLVGFSAALLRDHLDRRVQSREEVENETDIPVLGEIPRDKESRRGLSSLPSVKKPTGAVAEAARALRTALEFRGSDRALRTVVVTSPGTEDGKSFVSANLAVVFAQAGYRTVLVSADLRRPSLETVFGSGRNTRGGLTGILAQPGLRPSRVAAHPADHRGGLGLDVPVSVIPGPGGESGDDLPPVVAGTSSAPERGLLATEVANLYFLPSGTLLANPADLLGSERMKGLLEQLCRFADLVILDTPPILAVTDAAILAGLADAVLVVAALGRTRRGAVQQAESLIAATNVGLVGMVVNKIPTSRFHRETYYSEACALPVGPDGVVSASNELPSGTGAPSGNGHRRPAAPAGA